MNRRFLFLLLLVVSVTLSFRQNVSSPAGLAFANSPAQRCEGIVNGTKYPFLVPAHLVWGEVWSRLGRATNAAERARLMDELGVEPSVFTQILSIAAFRSSEAARAQGLATQEPQIEEVLTARDMLVRAISPEDEERVSRWVRSLATRPYRLGISGEIKYLADGRSACKVSIDGKKAPHLIPESEYWALYFRALSNAAALKRTSSGEYERSAIQALQAHHLPIPENEILAVLAVATDVTAKINALDVVGENVNHLARLEEIAGVALAGRNLLIRALPPGSWDALRTEAQRIRRGTIFDFPGI